MADRERDYYDKFTKEIFETLRSMSSNDERREFVVQTYENLYEKLKSADNQTSGEAAPAAPVLDMEKLRADLGQIRGIGGQRLDEIMSVIEKHLGYQDTASDTVTRK